MKKIMKLIMAMLMLCLMATSAFAWWDTNYYNRYELNLTNPSNFDRTYEPVQVDVSSVACEFGDKRDLRAVYNDNTEVPSQLLSDGVTLVMVVNVTASFDGNWGYIYCNNSGASAPTYSGIVTNEAINLTGVGTPRLNVSVGAGLTEFNFRNGVLWHSRSDNGWTITSTPNDYLSALRFDAGTFPYWMESQSQQSCWLQENGSQYMEMFCNNTNNISMNFEIYYGNKMLRITTDGNPSSVYGWFTAGGASGTSGTQKYMIYPNGTSTFRVVPTTDRYTLSRGMFSVYINSYDYGFGAVWNESIMSPYNYVFPVLNTADNRPYFTMFSDTNDASSGNHLNLTLLGLPETNFWLGHINRTELGLNQTYDSKMFPVSYLSGSEEAVCPTDWYCSLYGSCNTSDIRPCIEATDNNSCGYNYTGDYSEFEQSCDYCTPSWYCSSYQLDCPVNKVKECYAVDDTNDCYALTGLGSDQFNGTVSTYNEACGYQGTYITGDFSGMLTTGLGNAGVELITVMSLVIMAVIVGFVGYRMGAFKRWLK